MTPDNARTYRRAWLLSWVPIIIAAVLLGCIAAVVVRLGGFL